MHQMNFEETIQAIIATEIKKIIPVIEAMVKTEPVNNKLLSQNDVMRRYNISKPTVIAWTKSGRLKAVRIHSRVFYPEKDLV